VSVGVGRSLGLRRTRDPGRCGQAGDTNLKSGEVRVAGLKGARSFTEALVVMGRRARGGW
jgi:hypothetical protein